MPVQMIKFISNDYSPRCDLIISDNLKDTTKLIAIIFAAIASPERQGDLLLLENIQSDSEHLASFKKMSETANASYVSDLKLCTPWIDTTRDWETFYASLPRRIKMTFNNIRNRLHRLGDVQICKFKTLASLEDMAAVSRKSWKFREGKSFVSTPARKKFFELLSRAAGEKGWLRCWILMVDDQPIAFEYHLRYKSKEIALLADFNQDFAAYSPGAYLDHCITKEIFDDEISEYDLGGSFDQYKKKWQPKLRHSEDCYFYGSAPLARLLNALDARLVPPLRGLKKQLNALVAQGKIAIFSQPPKGK